MGLFFLPIFSLILGKTWESHKSWVTMISPNVTFLLLFLYWGVECIIHLISQSPYTRFHRITTNQSKLRHLSITIRRSLLNSLFTSINNSKRIWPLQNMCSNFVSIFTRKHVVFGRLDGSHSFFHLKQTFCCKKSNRSSEHEPSCSYWPVLLWVTSHAGSSWHCII